MIYYNRILQLIDVYMIYIIKFNINTTSIFSNIWDTRRKVNEFLAGHGATDSNLWLWGLHLL